MLIYKILITQEGRSKKNIVRLVTPDERSHDCVQDPTNSHLYKVEASELSSRPYDATIRIASAMTTIKRQWFKDQMYLFIEFLLESSEIRLVYLKERFSGFLPTAFARRSLLSMLSQYGALDQTTHGGYKRSIALNEWLEIARFTFTDTERGTAPEVPFDRLQKTQERDSKRKLSKDEISVLGIDELRDYIERVKKGLKTKDLHWLNNLLYQKRSEALTQQGEADAEYTTIDRTKK